MDYSDIYTKDEVDELLMEIEEKERNFFRRGYRKSSTPGELQDVKKALKELSVINLTVAIRPSADFLAKIGRWLRDEIDQRVVLDIKVDPSIIAGAIISFKGYYQNLSAGKKLREWFGKNKDEIF